MIDYSSTIGGPKGRSRHWDNPHGMGWKLWRRAHATGRLTRKIQRAVGQSQPYTLMARSPLLAEIRRRWGVDAAGAAYRFGPGLPFFIGRLPRVFTRRPVQEPASIQRSPHRSADSAAGAASFGISRSSEPAQLFKARPAGLPVRRARIAGPVLAARGRSGPKSEPLHPRTSNLQGPERSGAARVAATDSNIDEGSAQAEASKEGSPHQSGQPTAGKSASAHDAVTARPKIRAAEPMTGSSMDPPVDGGGLLFLHRKIKFPQGLPPRSLGRQYFQLLFSHHRSNRLPTAILQRHSRMPGSIHPPEMVISHPAAGKDSASLLPEHGSAAGLSSLSPPNPVEAAKEAILSRKALLNPLAGGSSHTAHTAGTPSRQAVIRLREETDLIRPRQPGDRVRKGLRRADRLTGKISRTPAAGSATTVRPLDRRHHAQSPSYEQIHKRRHGGLIGSSAPLAFTFPVGRPQKAIHSKKFPVNPLAVSPSLADPAASTKYQVVFRMKESKAPLVRPRERNQTGLQRADAATVAMMQTPVSGLVTTGRSRDRQDLRPRSTYERAQTRSIGKTIGPSLPLALANLSDTKKETILYRKTGLNPLTGGLNPVYPAVIPIHQDTFGVGKSRTPLTRPKHWQKADLKGPGTGAGGMPRTPLTGLAEPVWHLDRSYLRKETGSRHDGAGTRLGTGPALVPGIAEAPGDNRSALDRDFAQRDPALRHRSSHVSVAAEGGIGLLLPVIATTLWRRIQYDHETPRVRSEYPTMAVTRRAEPIGKLAAGEAAGKIYFPNPGLTTVQGPIAARSRDLIQGKAFIHIRESGFARTKVANGSSGNPVVSNEPGIVHRCLLLNHGRPGIAGLRQETGLKQPGGAEPAASPTFAVRGDTRPAVGDYLPSSSGTPRAIQPGITVHSLLMRRVAAGQNFLTGWDENPPAGIRGTAPTEMPFLHHGGKAVERHLGSNHQINRSMIETNPLQALSTATTNGTTGAAPTGGHEESPQPGTEPTAANPQLDPDELAEKVWQKLMRKLTIEQERRGCQRWSC